MRKVTLAHLVTTVIWIGFFVLLFVAAPSAEAGSRKDLCGGAGQRPCTLFEAFPSCDSGLAEDFLLNTCVAFAPGGGGGGGGSRPTNCGREGQRPCTVLEAFPSCASGLVENFFDNRCVQPGGGTQPEDVVNSFQPPNCNEIFTAANIFALNPRNDPFNFPDNLRDRIADILRIRGPLGSNLNGLYNYKLGPETIASITWDAIPKDSIGTPARIIGALIYYAILYCGLTLERDVALESELAIHQGFDEVKGNVTQVKQSVSDVRSSVTGLSADVAALAAASAATQQALGNLASTLAARDAETRQKLAEVIELLNTPQGLRPGFPK